MNDNLRQTHSNVDLGKNVKNEFIRDVVNSVLCSIHLFGIGFSFFIFTTEVSLHYVVLIFIGFILFLVSLIQILLHKKNNKRWAASITLGSTLALLITVFSGVSGEELMKAGQLITGVSFFVCLWLYILIWKK
jgi:hypothetical protein